MRAALVALAVLLSFARASAAGSARVIAAGEAPISGTWAAGAEGDLLLEAAGGRFVIDAQRNPHGLAPTGGSLIDAAPAGETAADGLGMIQLLLSDDDLDGVAYDSVLIDAEGGGRVRAVGRGLSLGSIRVETIFRAGESGGAVEIVTILRNTGQSARRIRPADRILLGGSRIAPEALGGATGQASLPRAGMRSIALLAPGADYVYSAESAGEGDAFVDSPDRGTLLCRHDPLSLGPGESAVWRRRLDAMPPGALFPAATEEARGREPAPEDLAPSPEYAAELAAYCGVGSAESGPGSGRFAALDLRVASAASLGPGARSEIITRAAALAGLDAIVIADRNTIARAEAPQDVAVIPGLLAESPGIGRFLSFPVSPRSGDPRSGAPAAVGTVPEYLFGAIRALGRDAFITVVEGRDREAGYFERMQLDPATGRTRFVDYDASFDAIEVLSARAPEQFDALLADWFSRLNAGGRVTALGGSGCEGADGPEIGSVRTLVDLRAVEDDATGDAAGDSAADSVLAAPGDALGRAVARRLLAGRAVVSSGLSLDVSLDETWGPGDLATRPGSSLAGTHSVRVVVRGPAWAACDSVFVYRDGRPIDAAAVGPDGREAAGEKARVVFEVPISGDGWIVAVARGGGYLAPAWPRAAARGLVPIAVANPIYVDADGDGTYTRP